MSDTAIDDEPALAPARFAPGPPPARGLSSRARRRASDFMAAFFSRDGESPPAERLAWALDDLDDFLGRAGLRARMLFTVALFAITWGAPLLIAHVGPLGSLRVPRRVDALSALEHAPGIALALFLVRAITSIVYYEHPDAAAELRWDQRCLGGGGGR